jgi:pimeloyl-ACP methyl ester carboxylesterase
MQTRRRFYGRARFACVAQLRWAAFFLAAAIVFCPATPAVAAPPPKGKSAEPAKAKKMELPKPQDLVLQTGDGLELALTYYPGTQGKDSVPVVLLHMFKQSRNDYKDLAPSLQRMGYAVVMPDLRGHGESTRLKSGTEINATALSPKQFTAMVNQDMAEIKLFLWERNNQGELNIDKLCVVGAEMGASVALDFALADALDQDRNRVLRPDYKLGRFVKALVLISPELSFPGLSIRDAAAHPAIQRDIAMLIVVGKQDSRAQEEAKRIHALFERYHPSSAKGENLGEKPLIFSRLDTSLQGTKLLDPKFKLPQVIGSFIYDRLVKSRQSSEWIWRERKVPHA